MGVWPVTGHILAIGLYGSEGYGIVMVQFGMAWYGMVWYGMIWFNTAGDRGRYLYFRG